MSLNNRKYNKLNYSFNNVLSSSQKIDMHCSSRFYNIKGK